MPVGRECHVLLVYHVLRLILPFICLHLDMTLYGRTMFYAVVDVAGLVPAASLGLQNVIVVFLSLSLT